MNRNDERTEPKDIMIVADDDSNQNETTTNQDKQVVISIESTSQEEEQNGATRSQGTTPLRKWLWVSLPVAVAILLALLVVGGWKYYSYYYRIGVPISVSCDENIAKLQKYHTENLKPEIVLTSDSVLGVALNMYKLSNVQAEISTTEPDTADKSVWMYSRSADYTSNHHYIGSMVMKGKELASDQLRLGYCAMANGNIVIGVSRSDKVKDYVMEHKGSFFRQFILLSNGVMPPKFHLHGKVERRALARMNNDDLYYIESRHPETMWDFADALREYGFADAIYITGGKYRSYYRTADGQPHYIGSDSLSINKENRPIVPWIVFKAR